MHIQIFSDDIQSVVATILTQNEPSPEAREELARLLNAISSFRSGRNYLVSIGMGKDIVYQMALALRTKRVYQFAADHLLAALQKLSIRSNVQKELIVNGMIEWLLNYLEGGIGGNINQKLSPNSFSMEFGTSMLGNLCANPVSQSTLLRHKDQLLALLAGLLQLNNVQLFPYVHGVLYILLTGLARMRVAAKERGDFETILLSKMEKQSTPMDIKRQSAVLLAILKDGGSP